MADENDVRRIAATLPETEVDVDGAGQLKVTFRGKLLAWTWLERPDPKGPRVPNPSVLALRVAGQGEKEELLASEPRIFFTEPHYDGYPAVLARLDAIDADELGELITDAWRLRAPKRMQQEHGL
ncbi:MAG TPA: MmcQ/YjbR family DNA-binding protein [Nocardioidaceae bacterium]|nr:MmcQ/YjbR family DNA-binding protein [Nocardioidaceae bacterium]